MIVGLGCDIVNIERVQKLLRDYGTVFLRRTYSLAEQQDINKFSDNARKAACQAAKYFAAKEAFVKALGTGFSDGIGWTEIEVTHDALGKPELKISGKAAEKLALAGGGNEVRAHLSLSDDYPFAQAVVIIEICYC